MGGGDTPAAPAAAAPAAAAAAAAADIEGNGVADRPGGALGNGVADIDKNWLSSTLVDCYFGYGSDTGGRQLVKHQLDSFNDFISAKLEQIIDGFNSVDINNTFLPDRNCYKYVVSLSMCKPTLTKPMITEKDGSSKVMLPNDARLRNLTYSAPIMCDMNITTKTYLPESSTYAIDTKTIHSVKLGNIPIMVRSEFCMLKHAGNNGMPNTYDECRYDHGGYFIVNGNEKVVISQDRIAENRIYVFLNTKATCYSHIVEVRSVHESKFGIPRTLLLKLSNKTNNFGRAIKICMQYIKQDVPLFVIFRALGVESDKDIVDMIVDVSSDPHATAIVNELRACMNECSGVRDQKSACEYLAKHMMLPMHMNTILSYASSPEVEHKMRANALRNMLYKDLLPHTGPDLMKKAVFIASMVSKLLRCYLRLAPLDDRDSYVNKRLDAPGVLMANLFRQYFGRVVKDTRMLVQKEIKNGSWRATNKLINVITDNNVYKLVKSSIIESGLKYGLATGNWGAKTNHVRQGVAQMHNRMTYPASMSHLRRINTPMKAGKIVQPRKLHATQWGIICPSETPEGASVGLVKNMALLATISTAAGCDNLIKCIADSGDPDFEREYHPPSIRNTRVVINGDVLGVHHNPHALYSRLKRFKRCGTIDVFTSIVWSIERNTITLCTEGGRFLRPLLVIDPEEPTRLVLERPENAHLLRRLISKEVQWHELVIASAIEYMDVEESNTTYVAMNIDDVRQKGAERTYTHAEVSSFAILGVLAGSIPFSDRNQAPRNTYQSAMGKQAIGVYASNYRHRFDTISHVLTYPQKPLVSTHTARLMKCDELPCGQNVIVAFACFTGFNQEDSVICNAAAVQRGLLGTTLYRTFREQNTKNHSTGEEEFFCRPDPLTTRGIKPYNYDKLDASGFVPEGTAVGAGDVIIGRCMPQKQGQTVMHKDTSVAIKNNEMGVVDRNCHGNRHFTNVTGDGYTFAKVRLRQERVPTIGDKVSSRHGQKGTIGMLYNDEDMPFTASGISPSIIVNPHAIPSRMTIGQLMEALESKAAALSGDIRDATPFTGRKLEDIRAELADMGVEQYGNEIMYNPRTGEQMECAIFVCPTYYQRLKHMVVDKIHSRAANGPVVLLTRQPAEGRARDGGLRLGEMELECMWAHGSMHFLKERFMECSDNYRIFVCKQCGMMATVNPDEDIYSCTSCQNVTMFDEVRIPYASKLLIQEIQTMGIASRFITQ